MNKKKKLSERFDELVLNIMSVCISALIICSWLALIVVVGGLLIKLLMWLAALI